MPSPTTSDSAASLPVEESASGIVFWGIVNGLADQQFMPGQRLVEVDLAAQFGVSRNSVREALQRLAADGLIDIFRNKGATIRSLTLRETMEVFDVAERMTGLLAKSAARAIAEGQSAAAIEQAMQELAEADKQQSAAAFALARRSFYRALLTVSNSRELKRLFPSIQMPIVYAQHRPAGLQKVRMKDYKAMSQAILRGDETAADEAGMHHVRTVRNAIFQQIAPDDGTIERLG